MAQKALKQWYDQAGHLGDRGRDGSRQTYYNRGGGNDRCGSNSTGDGISNTTMELINVNTDLWLKV